MIITEYTDFWREVSHRIYARCPPLWFFNLEIM